MNNGSTKELFRAETCLVQDNYLADSRGAVTIFLDE